MAVRMSAAGFDQAGYIRFMQSIYRAVGGIRGTGRCKRTPQSASVGCTKAEASCKELTHMLRVTVACDAK